MKNRRSLSRNLPGLRARPQQRAAVQLGAARLGAAAVGAAAVVECGLVGCSRAWWNDRENDHLSKQVLDLPPRFSVYQRSDRNAARISVANSSGSSQAAK
jgi:hypothetical protein